MPKRLLAAALCFFAMNPLPTAQAAPPAPQAVPERPGMKLVWNDEFDKDGEPNPDKWRYELGLVRNNEPQLYQPTNARVENGLLIIEARKERVPNPGYIEGSTDWRTKSPFADYTSSSVTTKGKFSWTYGHFEMRARIDTRISSWPAFWTVGNNRPWPHNGEIDVMEFYNGGLLAKWHGAARNLIARCGTRKSSPLRHLRRIGRTTFTCGRWIGTRIKSFFP